MIQDLAESKPLKEKVTAAPTPRSSQFDVVFVLSLFVPLICLSLSGCGLYAKDGYVPRTKTTRLLEAIQNGETQTAMKLIEEKPSLARSMNLKAWTPLHYAASEGNPEMTRYLLKKGAIVNARTESGSTPLDLTDSEKVATILRNHGGVKGGSVKTENEEPLYSSFR